MESYDILEEFFFNNNSRGNKKLEQEYLKGKDLYQKFLKNLDLEIKKFSNKYHGLYKEITIGMIKFIENNNKNVYNILFIGI